MLNHVRREQNTMAKFGSALANYKIFRQKFLQIAESAHVLKHTAANGHGAAQRKTHTFNHACDHDTAKEFSIHSNRFQSRPEALARHCTVRAADQPYAIVLKLLGEMREQAGRHPHITVTHHQHVITRVPYHAVQAEGLGIGDGRLSRYDEARADLSAILADNFFRDGHGWIVRAMDAEQNFILRIILHHEAAQIFFQAVVMAAERLEHTDRRLVSGSRQSDRQKPPSCNNNQDAVNERTGKKDRQSRCKDYHNAGLFSMLEPSAASPERPLEKRNLPPLSAI